MRVSSADCGAVDLAKAMSLCLKRNRVHCAAFQTVTGRKGKSSLTMKLYRRARIQRSQRLTAGKKFRPKISPNSFLPSHANNEDSLSRTDAPSRATGRHDRPRLIDQLVPGVAAVVE